MDHYASVGGALAADSIRHVCPSVCLCVCVILQRAFLCDGKELSNEKQLQLNILPPLNWLDFCFKALLSSYSVMCSP